MQHLSQVQQSVGVEIAPSVLHGKCRVACRTLIWSRIKFASQNALVINGPVSLKVATEMGYDTVPQQRLFMNMWEGTYKKICTKEINSKRSSVCQTIGVFLFRKYNLPFLVCALAVFTIQLRYLATTPAYYRYIKSNLVDEFVLQETGTTQQETQKPIMTTHSVKQKKITSTASWKTQGLPTKLTANPS